MFYKEDAEREKIQQLLWYHILFFDELLLLADKLAFIDKGKLIAFGDRRQVLKLIYENAENHIVLPDYMRLLFEFEKNWQ